MKKQVLLSVLLVWSFAGYSQAVLPTNVRAQGTLERLDNISTNEVLYGIPMPPGKVVGDSYYTLYWNTAILLLYDREQMIEGFPARYDIGKDELELKGSDGVKVLQGAKVKSFVWMDSVLRQPKYFVNAKDFLNEKNAPLNGFFHVLTDGSIPLLKRTTVSIKKADYNVGLSVGSLDDKIFKKTALYYCVGTTVFEVPSSKKKLFTVFGAHATSVEQFIKDKSLSTSRESHLMSIFEYYNSLVAAK